MGSRERSDARPRGPLPRGFGSRERSDARPRGPLPRGFGRYPSLTSFLHNRICERSSNGMAAAFRADSHGFARAQRRPAEGSPAKGFRPIPVFHIFIQTQLNLRESPNGMASASQADSRGFDSRLSLQKAARVIQNDARFFVLTRDRAKGSGKTLCPSFCLCVSIALDFNFRFSCYIVPDLSGSITSTCTNSPMIWSKNILQINL